MKTRVPALLVVCGTLLLSHATAARAAGSVAQDVPVKGGVAALAAIAAVNPAPDRARAMPELVRAIYSWPQAGPYSNEPVRRRIAAFFTSAAASDTETVPIPLSVALWSQAILHRTVTADTLAGAILAERPAALMCYGLSGMDDATLAFFSEHPSLLSRLADRAPAPFAAFGESVRVRNGRVVPKGGDAVAVAWEAVVGEKLDRPERFIAELFESDKGRLAYLYDVMAQFDDPTLALVLGAKASPEATASLRRLATVVRRAFQEWDVTTAPFVRPQVELGAFLARLRNASDGNPAALVTGSAPFWLRVFGEGSDTAAGKLAAEPPADVATLAEMILVHPARERERRVELFTFGQRVFAKRLPDDEVFGAIRGLGPFPALMLTLERMSVRTPAIYAAAARHAERLTGLDGSRAHTALAQFQGSVAFLARLTAAGSIDTAAAEKLLSDLLAVKLNDDGRYDGGIAAWFANSLLPALPAGVNDDARLLAAAAGPPAPPDAARVEWEGQRYRVDPGAAELRRLMRTRDRQQEVSFDAVLGVAAVARRLSRPATLAEIQDGTSKLTAAASDLAAGDRGQEAAAARAVREAVQTLAAIKRPNEASDARRIAAQLTTASDVMLGDALLSLAYAFDLGDPEGTILIAGDPSRRHDFGFNLPGREARLKAAWSIANVETRGGPWHLVGSALALDMAMAQLALRRISVDRVPESPMLNLMQRDGFAGTVAIMNPRAFADAERDAIALAVQRGYERVRALGNGSDTADALTEAVGMDGWRARALKWTLANEPDRVPSLFSAVELLVLGGGTPSAFHRWGVYALRTAGCLCPRLPEPGEWRHWWGLSQSGLPATLVADLTLQVAVVLHNLQLPAVLTRPVLAAAMQDFVDNVNPTDGNDWLTLARAVQTIGRERFEDYVAAATAEGPLVPDDSGEPGQR